MDNQNLQKNVYLINEIIDDGSGHFIEIYDDKKKAFERFVNLLVENWNKREHLDGVDDDEHTMAECINLKRCNIQYYHLEMLEAQTNNVDGVEV